MKAALRADSYLLVSDGTDGEKEAIGDDIVPEGVAYGGDEDVDDEDALKSLRHTLDIKKALPKTDESLKPVKKVPGKKATANSARKAGKPHSGHPQAKKPGGDPKKKVKARARRAVSARPSLL